MPPTDPAQAAQSRAENLLRIMSSINASLHLEEVLQIVMDQLIELTKAERGAIALVDPETADINFAVRRGEGIDDEKRGASLSLIRKVVTSGKGELLLSAMDDPRYAQNQSVVLKGLRSVLCVPLVTRNNEILGVVWIDNKKEAGIFNREDLAMMTEFGRQAANALDHANKYTSLLAMKSNLDSVFESLSSGIVAVDTEGFITAFNQSSERIFALERNAVLRRPIREALHGRAPEVFSGLMEEAMQTGAPVLGRSHSGHFAGAGQIELTLNAAPMKTSEGEQIGATLIIDDISEKQALRKERDVEAAERQRLRVTLGRLVSEDVAEMAEREEDALAQGGRIRTVSCLFVDIVGFTTRCEHLPPDRVIMLLNRYFSEMCEVVGRNQGTVKQFVGDEIMVLFNAAKETPDHPQLALWTAIEMVDRLQEMKALDPTGEDGFYDVKIGLHTGPVVYGAVGARDRMEFAAVGDTVNLTSRVMGLNPRLASRILISEDLYFEVYRRASRGIEFISHGPQQVRGRNQAIKVYEVRSTRWA